MQLCRLHAMSKTSDLWNNFAIKPKQTKHFHTVDLYLAAIQTCLPFLVEKGHRVWFYVVVEHLYGVRTLFKTFRLELFTDYGRIMSQFLNLYDQNHIPNQNRYLLKVQAKKYPNYPKKFSAHHCNYFGLSNSCGPMFIYKSDFFWKC